MTDARERLEQVIANALNDGWQHEAGRLADKLLAAGVTLAPEPPAPRPVWPVTEEAVQACRAGYYSADAKVPEAWVRAGLAAAAPHLWRALVASLPGWEGKEGLLGCVSVGRHLVPRPALAALADPYDGGGKGVGK